jgi:hypothetical protein
MGLLDKVKAQAEQAMVKAQQGVAQSQAKLDEMQARKQYQALLRDLGDAYYAQVRHGGPESAVADALAAVDAHVAAHGTPDLTSPDVPAQGRSDEPAATAAPAAPAAPPAQAGVQPGDFQID